MGNEGLEPVDTQQVGKEETVCQSANFDEQKSGRPMAPSNSDTEDELTDLPLPARKTMKRAAPRKEKPSKKPANASHLKKNHLEMEEPSDLCRQLDAENAAMIAEMRPMMIELGYDPNMNFMALPMFKRLDEECEREIEEVRQKIRRRYALASRALILKARTMIANIAAGKEGEEEKKFKEEWGIS